MAWHDRKYSGAIMRLVGLLLLGIAILVARDLFAVPDVQGRVTPSCYMLALIGMMSGSIGAALLLLGRHLFDQVRLSARWTVHRSGRARSDSA